MKKKRYAEKKFVVPPSGGPLRTDRLKADLHTDLTCPIHASRFKSAFTLIELLVVLAIIIVVTTISIPTIASLTSPKHALRKEGRHIMQLMGEARTAAMTRKAQIALVVDPAMHEIRMVEAASYRPVASREDRGFYDEELTNRYEKVVTFSEEFDLNAFTVDEIQPEEADPFQREEAYLYAESDEASEQWAVSFNHLGGSDGGGISLIKEGVRLDIGADLLTGRPKIVSRRAEE